MPHIFEQPCAARRPHSGLVLIKDHGLASGNAQGRKNPDKLAAKLVHAGVAGVAMMEWERVEMARILKMSGPVFSRRPGVNQYQSRVAALSGKHLRVQQKFNV